MPVARAKKRPDLERDTPIVALAVARAVIEIRSVQLARRAKVHYLNKPVFRRRLRAPGDRGLDTLYAFMHHWLDGELADAVPASRTRFTAK